jgi:hypothetical protein
MPNAHVAWEMAEQRAFARARYEDCRDCGGAGGAPTEDKLDLVPCETCLCAGRVVVKEPPLPAQVQRATHFVGGAAGIRESDNLSVTRAQFMRAYNTFAEETIRELQVPALPAHIELTAIGRGND